MNSQVTPHETKKVTEFLPIFVSRAISRLSPETQKQVKLLLGADEFVDAGKLGDDAKKFAETKVSEFKWKILLQLDDPDLVELKKLLS